MDRDGFWERARDFAVILLKVFAVLFLLQSVLIALHYKTQLPFIYNWVQGALGYYYYYVR